MNFVAARADAMPLAIVGVGALFPGSPETGDLWRNIVHGRDLLTDVPAHYWRTEDYYDPDPTAPLKTYARRGAFLPKVPFDAIANGLPPAQVPMTDAMQLLALIVARRVLEDACGVDLARLDRGRTSVILGVAGGTTLLGSMCASLQRPVWTRALRESGLPEPQVQAICAAIEAHYTPWTESTFPGLLGNVIAGRIASRFDLGGTNCVVDAACASSLAALRMAAQELRLGTSDCVITGGVDATNDPLMFTCFSKTPALSRSGDCRPFSADSDGTMLGEGVGLFALRRLADAERDGDTIYAVVRGLGASSDGRARSIYAPRAEGQMQALRRAYAEAGYSPADVALLEAHGTGTTAGDAAEIAALRTVFAEADADTPGWCALGSVKSQIGHTKSAAGAAALYKTVMALHHRVLPPTIKVSRPHPALETGPFTLSVTARPWVQDPRRPRRAGVSSFGFGGSNFHMTLEEYAGASRPLRVRTMPTELLLASGADVAQALDAARGLARAAERPYGLAAAARASQRNFAADAPVRMAFIAADAAQLAGQVAALAPVLTTGQSVRRPGVIAAACPADPGPLAFLFPGQGSQYVGMGADLACAFDDAARARQAAALQATDIAQPAIGITSQMLLTLLHAAGLRPAAAAGHSFGELSALHCAGVIDAATLRQAARCRGVMMGEAARTTEGAMLAVFCPAPRLEALLAQAGDADLGIANRNAPEQSVLAGPAAAIAAFAARLNALGIAHRRLPVATAFHSPMVAPARAPFRAALAALAFQPPRLPVHGCATGAPFAAAPDAIRDQLARQVAEPVLFMAQIEALYQAGVTDFVEVGPGNMLTELTARILAGRAHRVLAMDRRDRDGVTQLWEVLGALAVAGHAIAFDFAWDGYPETAPPEATGGAATLMVDGATYGRPYPPSGSDMPAVPPAQAPRAADAAEGGALPASLRDALLRNAEAQLAAQQAIVDGQAAHMAQLRALVALLSEAEPPGEPAALPRDPPARGETSAPVAAAPAPPRGAGLADLLIGIVADKTGYPAEMLTPEMELEADLGIDSIKRVEILAALREAAPELPEVDPRELAPLRTLRAILDRLGPVAAAVTPAPVPMPMSAAVVPSTGLADLLIGIVADKTGYPAEMLTPEMELEADLGIDSIKRVEILAALRDTAPELPEVDPRDLAPLRTLRAILDRLGPVAAAVTPVPMPMPMPMSAPVVPSTGLADLLIGIVADKTGYPAEMLTPEMELEADLGIDSIKRVEILAALRDAAPDLAEVDPRDLASLRTLRAILDRLGAPPAASLQRLGLVAAAAPEPDGAPALRAGMRVAVVGEGAGLAAALRAALAGAGLHPLPEAAVAEADAVVALNGLDGDADGAAAVPLHLAVFAAARAFAPRALTGGGSFVTVQDTGGDFGLSARNAPGAWLGGVAGIAKTAAAEWPLATVCAIDLERAGHSEQQLAARLLAALLAGGSAVELGLRADGRRVTLREVPLGAPTGHGPALPDRAVLVASGGGRGILAAGLCALAAHLRPRVLLLGRTRLGPEPDGLPPGLGPDALPRVLFERAAAAGRALTPRELSAQAADILAAREIRATLAALEQAGAEVRYRSVDVLDAEAVAAACAEARAAWGGIDGLIHGAGVLADRRIEDLTDGQFLRVFRTKVDGLRSLLHATREDALRRICLFSSVAGRYGHAGQVAYAAANEVLNKVAQVEAARRGAACRVVSLNWGPWDGGMVGPALREAFIRRGVKLIAPADGARAFVAEMLAGDDATGSAHGRHNPVEIVLGEIMPDEGRAVASAGAVAR